MEAHFAVHFSIRRGLGPDSLERIVEVGFDDIESDVTDQELRDMAVAEAESVLMGLEDYRAYGKNWIVQDVQRT